MAEINIFSKYNQPPPLPLESIAQVAFHFARLREALSSAVRGNHSNA